MTGKFKSPKPLKKRRFKERLSSLCPVTRKVKMSKREAHRKVNIELDTLSIYRCRHCDRYHLGHDQTLVETGYHPALGRYRIKKGHD